MNILKTIGKAILGLVIPTLSKEKSRINSVDTLISKKGNATQAEIIVALVYKIIRLLFIVAVTYAILSGHVTIGEVIKTITTITAIGI